MSLSSNRENFFVAHYDWLAAGLGVVALAAGGAFFALTLGDDADRIAAEKVAEIDRLKPSEIGVQPIDLAENLAATKLTARPIVVSDLSMSDSQASFLSSERRIFCKKCRKVLSGDVKECPSCHEVQAEKAAIVLDADEDGMPDAWELRYGLNPHDAADAEQDKDKDGFTNLEEYQAKENPKYKRWTDPTDATDHPDYLDSLSYRLPLKETYLPFVFTKATQIPGGWRCEFFDAKKKDHKRGNTGYVTAKVGDEIVGSGFTVKAYEQKAEKREKKGMKGMFFNVDVSEVKLERKTDGKVVTVVIGSPKTAKPVPVDVQATLVYKRGAEKTFDVVPGQEIELSGTKYKVAEVLAVGKDKAKVVVTDMQGKKPCAIPLEQ